MAFLGQLWKFMRVRKKLWLLPVIVVLLAQTTAVAPFIYTLF